MRWIAEWLAVMTDGRPTVLALDGIADADPTTVALLRHLAAGKLPLFILLTSTSPGLQATQFPGANEIELQPLPADAARELIRAIGVDGVDSERVDTLVRLAGGIPFYLEQLAPLLMHPLKVDHVELHSVIENRLLGTGAERTTLAAASALTTDFTAAEAAMVAERPVAEIEQQLVGLAASGVIEAVGDRYRFRHELMRQAAGRLVLDHELAAIHGIIADKVITGAAVGAPGALGTAGVRADHLERAGRLHEALDAYLIAGSDAQHSGAHREATRLFSQAERLLTAVSDPTVRAVYELALRPLRGLSAMSADGYASAEAHADFETCLALCRTVGARPELLPLLTGLWAYYMSRGDVPRSEAVAVQLREVIDREDDEFRPENESAFGVLDFFKGDYVSATRHLTPMIEVRTDAGLAGRIAQRWSLPNDPLTAGLVHLAVVLWTTGRTHEAFDAAERSLRRADSLPFPMGPFSLAYAKTYVGHLHRLRRDHAMADRFAGEVQALGERHGFAFWQMTGSLQLAIGRAVSGDPVACAALEDTATGWEAFGARVFLPFYFTELAAALGAGGQHEAGLLANSHALELAEETGAHFHRAETLRTQGILWRSAGAEDLAVRSFGDAFSVADSQGALVFALRAALALRASPDSLAARRGRVLVDRVAALFPPCAGYPELNRSRAGR
jgi:tetratricopeptide (TPR) repeat protein